MNNLQPNNKEITSARLLRTSQQELRNDVRVPKLRFKEFDKEWDKKKMFELSERIGDGLHGTPKYIDESEISFINGNNLIGGRIFITEKTKKVDEKTFIKNDKNLKTNTLLISLNGTIGNIARYNNEKVMLGKSVGYFNFKENSDYYYHVLKSPKIQRFFISELTGSTIKNLSLKTLRETNIPFPSLEEQQKIATFLTSVDTKLQQLNKKKELLANYKKGVMQQLFSQQLRFKPTQSLREPVARNEANSKQSLNNNEQFPDWEEKKLGEVATKKSSNISANTIEENYGNYKLYGASGYIKSIDFFKEEQDYISIVKDGAGVGRTLLCEEKSSVLGTLDIIQPKIKVNLYFLYSVLNNINFKKYTIGSTIPHIYFKDYSKEKIKIPSLKEQQKIANYLSALDKKIATVQTQIDKTQAFKKGLLQQMFV